MSQTIKIKKTLDNAILPTRGSEAAAGWDLYAPITENIVIFPHQTVKIDTGWSIELHENTFGAVFARSGLATKQGLRPANCVGVIDSDYRGSCTVAIHNDTEEAQIIKPNDRIAQLVVLPYIPIEFEEVDELSHTQRGFGGFGSTGR